MKNRYFDIVLNPENGTVKNISNPLDNHNMNWCDEEGGWGEILCVNLNDELLSKQFSALPLVSFTEQETESSSVYMDENISVKVDRFFCENGNFSERYTIKNLRSTDLFLDHGELSIKLPFNDVYTYAEDCMVNRCNTHIWCGYDIAYINALKMGKSDINLGLFLNKGSIKSYSVYGSRSNVRGHF